MSNKIFIFKDEDDITKIDVESYEYKQHTFSYIDIDVIPEIEEKPDIVICLESEKINSLEVAQVSRMIYQSLPIYFIYKKFVGESRIELLKNGFTSIFMFPYENNEFFKQLKNQRIILQDPVLKNYRSIMVTDLVIGEKINFNASLYLSKNKRVLCYLPLGEEVSGVKIKKLEELNLDTLFVHEDDCHELDKYWKNNFLDSDSGLTFTARADRIELWFKELLSNMLFSNLRNDTYQKSINLILTIKNMLNIVEKMNPNLEETFNRLVNSEKDHYSHLFNTTIFSLIFSKKMDHPNPELVAMASLLHDIGLILIDSKLASIPLDELSKSDQKIYKSHPNLSIELIHTKKIPLPDVVLKAIHQHHERLDGSGYPRGIIDVQIIFEARILMICDEIDYFITLMRGKNEITLKKILDDLIQENSLRQRLDLTLLQKLNDAIL